MPTGIVLDTSPQTYRNSQEFRAPIVRDISNAAPQPIPLAQNRPPTLSHLPDVPDKPRAALQRVLAVQAAEYPRIAQVIGQGTARNEYGASCVAYARSLGFNVSGNANTWPTGAKAVGYRVDTKIEIGAILVTSESSAGTSTGHVTGKVERIENGYAFVKEQNVKRGMLTAGWVPVSRVVAVIHLQ